MNQNHGDESVAERPKLLGGGAPLPGHAALLCLAVLPEQQADLQCMNDSPVMCSIQFCFQEISVNVACCNQKLSVN